MVVPQSPQRSRVTASSPVQTGQVAMTSNGTLVIPLMWYLCFRFYKSAFLFCQVPFLRLSGR